MWEHHGSLDQRSESATVQLRPSSGSSRARWQTLRWSDQSVGCDNTVVTLGPNGAGRARSAIVDLQPQQNVSRLIVWSRTRFLRSNHRSSVFALASRRTAHAVRQHPRRNAPIPGNSEARRRMGPDTAPRAPTQFPSSLTRSPRTHDQRKRRDAPL